MSFRPGMLTRIPPSTWRELNATVTASGSYVTSASGHDGHATAPGSGSIPGEIPQYTKVRILVRSDKATGTFYVEQNESSTDSLPWARVYSTTTPTTTTSGVDVYVVELPLYLRWFRIGYANGNAADASVYIGYVLLGE